MWEKEIHVGHRSDIIGVLPGWVKLAMLKIHSKGQQAHEDVLSTTAHSGNANQTTVRHHLTPVRLAATKKTRKKDKGY